MALALMLKEDGKLQGDPSVAALAEDEYFLAGSGMAELSYARWFDRFMPKDGSVTLDVGLCGLSIAGPRASELLVAVTHDDVSNAAFRFMTVRRMDVGQAPSSAASASPAIWATRSGCVRNTGGMCWSA